MNRREAIAGMAGGALTAFSQTSLSGKQIAPNSVTPLQHELRPKDITQVAGFPGHRMHLNISNRLLTFDVDYFVRLVEEHRWRDWAWFGEQSGKWLDAAILCSETFRNEELHDKGVTVLKRMIAAQQADGYLGITDTALRTPEHPLRGMDAYELYYILHGLLTAHEEWGSDAALTSVGRVGDYLIRYIGPGKAEFWPKPKDVTISGHEVHHGLEGTLLIDPMMRLYQNTREQRYLDWCNWVVDNIDKWSGTNYYSKLDQVAAGELGMNQLLPKTHAHTFQMNAQGLMRMYQATGDPSFLRKMEGAWRDITAKRMYITGAPSHREYYWGDFDLPNEGEGVETCGVMSWIQLNQMLLNTTGNPAHADIIERAMWNHTYASQTWEGDGFRYGVPMAGWKPSMYFTGPNCCSGSGPRMLGLLPGIIYGRAGNAVYVNQFLHSTATIQLGSKQTIEIAQRTNYPTSESIVIEVRPAESAQFIVNLRIPAWCSRPRVTVNGATVAEAKSGTYAAVDRTWKKGDRIEVTLPMEPTWTRGEHGNAGLVALSRGPMVYVVDGAWQTGDISTRLASRASAQGSPGLATVKASGPAQSTVTAKATPTDALGPFYQTEAQLNDGAKATVALSPFANLGRWYADPNAKPDIKDKLYGYSVWLPA